MRSLQLLRASAAWSVVFHHYYLTEPGWIAQLFVDFGNFGVDVFFALSGFVMFHSLRGRDVAGWRFLVSRWLRIAPAYWVATLLTVGLCQLLPERFANTAWTPQTLLTSLFFIPTENASGHGVFPVLPVGWTLNHEMFFYGLLALCLPLGRTLRFVACAGLLTLAPLVWSEDALYGSILANHQLIEFAAGMLVGFVYHEVQRPMVSRRVRGFLAITGVALCSELLLTRWHGTRLVASTGLLAAALLAEPWIVESESSLVLAAEWLGTVSYSTYLLHTLVIGLLEEVAGWAGLAWLGWVLPLAVVLVVLPVSGLGHRYLENPAWLIRLRARVGRG